jgi:segregation and condensation protein B
MEDIKPLIEAALFSAGRPLSLEDIARVCGSGNMGLIRKSADELVDEYAGRASGLVIKKTDDGYIMGVKPELEGRIIHLVPETEIPAPILKTLALIAYEQPVRQSKIIKERGNKAYAYIKFLKQQNLVESHKEGRSRILSVTPKFREYFHVEELNKLIEKQEEKKEGEADVASA